MTTDELQHLAKLAQRAAARAEQKGASADVFIQENETFSVTVRQGEVEKLKEAVSRSLRLRLFLGKKAATARTSDLSSAAVDSLVDEAVELARLTSDDESGGLPDRTVFPADIPDLQLTDPSWDDLRPEERIDMARRTEAAAYATSPLITNSEGAWCECERSRTVLANTLGFVGGYESTGGSIGTVPIASSNGTMQQDYWISVARSRSRLDSPEAVGRRAAERALRRLGARKVKTCQVPIVFDPRNARSLLQYVVAAVSGESVFRRRSFLVDRLGESVAASNVTILDDALMPGGLGSSPFDDEGVATQTTPVIENGVLKNYLHSSYSARRMNARPTGNGSRGGSGSIGVGPTNFYLKGGAHSPEEIIASVSSGLYVVEQIGSGVNTVSGDYSQGVTGVWIENGKLTYPVQEVTIAGNLKDMLLNIEMIGNDVEFLGAVAAPTLKIGSMTLSGE